MSAPRWFEPYEQAYDRGGFRAEEEDALSELTFALDAATWFRGREVSNDCA